MRLRVLAMAAVLGNVVVATAQSDGKLTLPELKYETYTLKYETYTLPNGLKVIAHENHRLPLVAVDVWYHVGPLNERAGRTGFAHLFEHMMFEGSEHVGQKAHMRFLQASGATDMNGTTNFDRTNYFETVPANQLELALWLESDRMGFLMEGLDRTLLQNQRDVVRNERRQHEGQPYSMAREEVFHQLFPQSHPYYADVMGSHADIEAARIADIRDFHQKFYTPNNASIAIAGDFDPKKLREMLTKYFGPIPAGPKVDAVKVETPVIATQRRVTVTDTADQPRLDIAWLVPKNFSPESYDMDAAMFALGGAKDSRLDDALKQRLHMAQRVTCGNDKLALVGIALCSVVARPGVKLEDMEAAFWDVVAKLRKDGPTANEVASGKAVSLTRKMTGLERLGGFGGVADTMDMYNQYTGDPGYLAKDIAAINAETMEGAKAAAVKYFTKDSAVVVYTVKGEKVLHDVPRSPADMDANVTLVAPYSAAFEQAQEWRKTVPAAGAATTVHLPVPAEFVLENGLKVMVMPEHSLPVVSMVLVTRAGSENDPAGKSGLAVMTASMMATETTNRALKELDEAQERIGGRIGSSTGMDSANFGITVLTSHAAEGMDLLSDVVERPLFRQGLFNGTQRQAALDIVQENDSVAAMARRVGMKVVYGDAPYGRVGKGTVESVRGMQLDDVTDFYATHVGPADSALMLAGDVSVEDARQIAEKYFGGWAGKATGSAVVIPPAPVLPKTHVVLVDKPNAPQTELEVFGVGVPEGSKDMAAIGVMNYTLGASFASRINFNLREQHGYTYGAHSRFEALRGGGTFVAGGLMKTDVTGAAAAELMHEIARFVKEPSTAAELKEAKEARMQSLPGQFETTTAVVGSMASLFVYGRPLDYFAGLPAKYDAVTLEDVARVAKQYLHPESLVIVAAGDKKTIEPQLKEAAGEYVAVRPTVS